jgi:hypothetical protein
MNENLKNAYIRAARTFVQTFIGVFLAGLLAQGGVAVLGDLADLTLLNQAAAASVVAVLSLVQNLLEGGTSVHYDRG